MSCRFGLRPVSGNVRAAARNFNTGATFNCVNTDRDLIRFCHAKSKVVYCF